MIENINNDWREIKIKIKIVIKKNIIIIKIQNLKPERVESLFFSFLSICSKQPVGSNAHVKKEQRPPSSVRQGGVPITLPLSAKNLLQYTVFFSSIFISLPPKPEANSRTAPPHAAYQSAPFEMDSSQRENTSTSTSTSTSSKSSNRSKNRVVDVADILPSYFPDVDFYTDDSKPKIKFTNELVAFLSTPTGQNLVSQVSLSP